MQSGTNTLNYLLFPIILSSSCIILRVATTHCQCVLLTGHFVTPVWGCNTQHLRHKTTATSHLQTTGLIRLPCVRKTETFTHYFDDYGIYWTVNIVVMSVEHGRSPQWKTIFPSHLDSVSPLASSNKTKLSSHSRKRYLAHTIDDFLQPGNLIRTMTSSGWKCLHSRESWHAHTYITSLHKICYCRLLRTSNHAPSPDPKNLILSKEVKGSPPRKWSQQGKHCHKLFPGTHISDLSSPLSPVSLSPVCVCVCLPLTVGPGSQRTKPSINTIQFPSSGAHRMN